MYLKDYERKRLLERGTMALVSDSEDEKRLPPTYDQEQLDLKKKYFNISDFSNMVIVFWKVHLSTL